MIKIIKLWASRRELNNPSMHTLSSYVRKRGREPPSFQSAVHVEFSFQFLNRRGILVKKKNRGR